MRKGIFFIVITLCGILGLVSTSPAQTEYAVQEDRVVTSDSDAGSSVVRVYGPEQLTELTRQAIQEQRPELEVRTYNRALKDRVWIEGTTGTGYMSLSPKRVNRMEKARGKGTSVYAALCTEQQGVIQKTVGGEGEWVRVKQKVARTRTVVRTVYAPPPPVYVPVVNVGYVVGPPYPYYGYRAYYGAWGGPHYRYYRGWGWRGYHSFHRGHGGRYASGGHH